MAMVWVGVSVLYDTALCRGCILTVVVPPVFSGFSPSPGIEEDRFDKFSDVLDFEVSPQRPEVEKGGVDIVEVRFGQGRRRVCRVVWRLGVVFEDAVVSRLGRVLPQEISYS